MERSYDVIVVGAGITGLAIAAMLSRDGRRVLVLEKGQSIGGRARVQKRDGYSVDYGIHLVRFGPKSALAKICRHIGHDLRFASLGPACLFDRDGRKKLFPTSPAGLLRTEMLSLKEKFLGAALMLKIRLGEFGDLRETSVSSWMERNAIPAGGGLGRYFTLVSASMMVCPFLERSSAGEMLENIGKVLRTGISVMYPRGGWQPILDAFEGEIRRRGDVVLGTTVGAVIIEEGRAVGVSYGSEEKRAGVVIVSVPVQELFTSLLAPYRGLFPKSVVDACETLRPTSGVVLDYGLKGKVSSDSGLVYLWEPISFGLFTSNVEPSLAPRGRQLLTWLRPTAPGEMEDATVARKREEETEVALFRAYPGLERSIEWRRAMHLRMIDGVEINVSQHRGRRLGPRLPGIENLYLVGDSTAASGAGGDVGYESVLECYRALREGGL